MAVILDPNSIGKSTGPKLQTISRTRQQRVDRIREDLDHSYIEADTKAKAQYLGMPYIDLYGFPIDTTHLILMKKEEVQEHRIGIFMLKNKEIYFATPEPRFPGQADFLDKYVQRGYTPKIHLCSDLGLNKIIGTYDHIVETKDVKDDIDLSTEQIDKFSSRGELSLVDMQKLLASVSTSEIVETILMAALQNKASDIHFEPEKETYNLRLRLDGVLHTFANLKKEIQKPVESRLKLLSGVKLNVDNVPQDGRFTFKASGRDIDVRVSMLPSNYGYSVVMRLLGTGTVALELDALGFSGLAKQRVTTAIEKPQGLILTTGPTGSGKTTTLYTFLNHLNDGEGKIITLEDPIEYKLAGISQTQIDAAAGYTFGSGLRSILRQDPDIVMVGEIRDRETAEIAIQASLTGHQVLSTIHTNDAAGAIPRLMEMNMKGFLIADSLSVAIGQRLVRKLCENCKREDHLSLEQKQIVINELAKLPKNANIHFAPSLKFYTADGCIKCNGLGYKGRIGVYEVLSVTEGLKALLSDQFPSIVQVRQVATREGMVTMLQDAILKAMDGTTDLKEILKNIS